MTLQHVKVALRSLRRDFVVSAIIVALLGLGLGANAAIFSVADALLLRTPAGVKKPDQLRRFYVRTRWTIDNLETTEPLLNYPQFDALRTAFSSRALLAAYTPPDSSLVDATSPADKVRVSYATSHYFPVLGISPSAGRFFGRDEDTMGSGAEVVVLSYGYWQRRFGGDPSVVGTRVSLGHRRPTIVGVAPQSFIGADLDATDMWLPLGTRAEQNWDAVPWFQHWRSSESLKVVGRVLGSTSDAWFQQRGTPVLRAGRDGRWQDSTATAVAGPIQEMLAPSEKPAVAVTITERLVAFALLVMLIACANVANLLLGRALQRRREIAIRTALGMSRAKLIQEIVLESVVLALLASICALALAAGGGVLLRTLIAPTVHWTTSPVDLRIVAFTMLLALLVGVVVGLPPALHVSRSDLGILLSSGPRVGGGRRTLLRTGMIVGQATLSLLLLVGAGLFVRSWLQVRAINLGYDVDQLIAAKVEFRNREGGYIERNLHDDETTAGLYQAAAALRGRSGIVSVALASGGPMESYILGDGVVRLPGKDSLPRLDNRQAGLQAVSAAYFATAGQRLLRGRSFADDDERGPPVAIVSETAARLYWPGENALGKCIIIGPPGFPCRPVVGIVADAHLLDVVEAPGVWVYKPLGSAYGKLPHVLVARLDARNAKQAAQAVHDELRRAIPDADRIVLTPVTSLVDVKLHPWRVGASLFSVLGLLALVIAALGVYSVVSYNVSQRTREIGVRVALGAMRGDIMQVVIGAGLRGVLLGIGCGVLAVFALRRVVAPLLYHTSWLDPFVIAGAALVLLFTTLAASVIPGRRALRLDPAEVMRSD